jgi:hypothetical protein
MNLSRLAVHAAASYGWSRSLLDESGAWRGSAPTDVAAYYKAPWSFSAAGDPDAGARSLSHIQANYLLPDGDLRPTANQVLLRRHPLYPHAHVAIGAIRTGRTETADRVLDFLVSQCPDRQVAWGDRRQGDESRRFDAISTAAIGLAFLERGDLDQARGAADFLIRLLDIQPKREEIFFSSVSEDGRLLTSFPDEDSSHDRCVRLGSRFQVWWALSFPLVFLARYSEIAAESAAWRGALGYLALLERSPQAWDDLSAGKLALGCALLYRQAGDPEHRKRALRAICALVGRQLADGRWNACNGGEGGSRDAPTAMGFEVNLEFALLMSLVGRSLAERDGRVFAEPGDQDEIGILARWVCRSERALLRTARAKAYRFHATRLGRWLIAKPAG